MATVEQLVVLRERLEELRQIALRERMEGQARLVEQQDGALVRIGPLDEEYEVKTEKPLQSGAPAFKLDLFRALVVRHPNAEVVAVGLEPEAVLALLPPSTELRREQCGRRLEQDAPLRNGRPLRVERGPSD